jgi:ribokinase
MTDPAEKGAARVCVVGSLNMDLVVRVPRLPAPGETVLGGAYRTFPGGKGSNQAVAARRMGAAVWLVGCLGDDAHAPKVRQALEADGVDLTHLRVRAGETTGLALITVAEGGENTIVVAPGANAGLSPEQVREAGATIASCGVLLAQLEVPVASVLEAARIAREHGRAVILNAAPARQLPDELLRLVDVLVVNRTEATRLLAVDPATDPARVALSLPELGPPVAVLTLGAQGAILNHRGRRRRILPHPVQAIDATGAGDAFCGALAACWPDGVAPRSPEEFRLAERALVAASVAGSLAAGKTGAIPSLPTIAEVKPIAQAMTVPAM